jgi:uncharacterized membrane protein YczE
MIFGLFLFALGIVLTIMANIGFAPWDVFHVGLAITTGITIGTASIVTGITIGVIAIALGEKFGLGMLLNMVLIGVFIDLIMLPNIIPVSDHFGISLAMLTVGLVLISIGSYFYIKTALGAGPRDSLMIALNRRTKMPIGVCRGLLELMATVVGWLLGGMVGIGTVISVIMIGVCVQGVFAIFKFDVKSVKHETLRETYQSVKRAFRKS